MSQQDAVELLERGLYAECALAAAAAIEDGRSGEAWHLLKLRAEVAMGAARAAMETYEDAAIEHPTSIALRWHARPAFLRGGRPERAATLLDEIESFVRNAPRLYASPENRVIVGRFLLLRGVDPRTVLERIYDPLAKEQPEFVGTFLASGELALEKQDHAVAAQEFGKALKLAPADPEALFGMAQAAQTSDPAAASKHLRAALERNPNHVGCLLSLADDAIDREEGDEAATLIARVLAIHPGHATALAYRAVLAHVQGDAEGEKRAREEALAAWPTNPEVDHVIGRKLSQKYRFAEGAAHQRRALELDRSHLPSKVQLCQDLLRLGKEEEGWKLAREVYELDGYNVVAHNLSILREQLRGYRRLETSGIVLRMEGREADIYGEEALELLARARNALCERYGVALTEPVVVEIFPEQKDFAIRTFGIPGGAGFLGVCFGNVITAGSPASRADHPANWEAVLWHEFCHVVTLHATRNRMPRWLSEGISVYEERRADPTWGQTMDPRYLDFIAESGVVPVSRLSAAFLSPPTPAHLEFAYYQSSLVVECLVERHGLDALKGLLSDLAAGTPINGALERRTGSLDAFEKEAEAHVRARAAELAARADWSRPRIPDEADLDALTAWNREHPTSYRGLLLQAAILVSKERWTEAREILERLIALCPEFVGPGSAHELLARVLEKTGDAPAEIQALRKWTGLDANAVDPCLRLLDLCAAAGDWEGAATSAERILAVNPLLKAPHRSLVQASHELGTPGRATGSYRALLAMDPTDPADLHLGLARLLRDQGKLKEAKRHVLQALEEAPRFREAQRELLALARESGPTEEESEAPIGGELTPKEEP